MNQLQVYMPPPSNWQDFQTLIGDIAKAKFIEHSVQEYGRQGQSQNGVDLYAVDLWRFTAEYEKSYFKKLKSV